MTEQEKLEFWKNQKLFTMSDIIRTSTGKFLMKSEAMVRVAQEYQIDIAKGKIYTLREARDLILNEEVKRREKPLQDSAAPIQAATISSSQKVASYFKILPDSKKNNMLFISRELNRIFYNVKPSEVVAGIKLAQANGLIANSEELISAYHNQLGLKALSVNFEKINLQNTNQTDLVNKVAGLMFNNYLHGYDYGQLNYTLQNTSLSSEVKQAIETRFYELLMPQLAQRYQDTKLRGSLLAKDILENYESFNMERIFAMLDVVNKDLQMDRVRFDAYRIEDEPFVRDILLAGSRDRSSAEDIVAELENFQSEYPKDFILATIRDMQARRLKLPYDEIINGFTKQQVRSHKDENPQTDKEEELEPVQHDTFALSPVGDFVKVDDKALAPLDSSNFNPVSTGKKYKILKREKAITAPDKKAVIAGLIVAAGAISTAVLTSIFGVSPLEAAKNTVASIASFTSGNAFLSQIIPTTVGLIQNLSLFGVATAGTVAWLRRRNAKKKDQRKREIAEVLEEVMKEKEEAEKGGKTR